MTTFLSAVFVFGLLIFFHELGHFSVAKAFGVKVYEFSLGFGTKLLSYRKGETQYNLRLFPLGGFVRMAGMDKDEDLREAKQEALESLGRPISEEELGREIEFAQPLPPEKSFANKPVWQRAAIIAAGPIMNLVLAALLFTIIGLVYGYYGDKPAPKEQQTVIVQTIEDKAAAKAGIKPGDKIISINNQPVSWAKDVTSIISKSVNVETKKGQELTLTILREGKEKVIKVTPAYDEKAKAGRIGILLTPSAKVHPSFLGALWLGVVNTIDKTYMILVFLGQMIVGLLPFELAGPVRVVDEIGKAADVGFEYLLSMAALLSINIGLFNLFPIPALDGSRLIFLFLESLRGKPVDPSKENFIHLIGFALLILLMVVITVHDIRNML